MERDTSCTQANESKTQTITIKKGRRSVVLTNREAREVAQHIIDIVAQKRSAEIEI